MLLVLLLGSCLLGTMPTFGNFAPLVMPVGSGQNCQGSVPDISEVLSTVAESILNDIVPAAHPASCLEIKEGSPQSPSGYYTLSNETGGTVIVYCNMDGLYPPCSSIEQLLDDIQSKYNTILMVTETLSEGVQKNHDNIITMEEKVYSNLTSIQRAVTSLGDQVLNLTYKQDRSFENTDSAITEVSNNISTILDLLTANSYTTCNATVDGSLDNGVNKYETLCNTTGPWTNVAYLNMSNSTHDCPSGFQVRQDDMNGVRACIRPIMDGGCVSVTFPTNAATFSQVCGRVIGYQFLGPHGFRHGDITQINETYVDGVSLTYGSPRQHIWTFAAEALESQPWCPCASGSTTTITPSFIGNDYFCEAGTSTISTGYVLYSSDPLWDGEGCNGAEAPCCQASGIPWFHKVLDTPSTDDIELRLCAADITASANPGVGLYEIYIM